MVNLGDAMLAGEALDRIQARVVSAGGADGDPRQAAAFIRHESEGRLHCEVKVYFTPAMAGVATAVGATRCNKPAVDGLDLLAGSPDAWSVFFPRASV